MKEGTLGGNRKRKKDKKKRRKRSIVGDVGYGRLGKGKKGGKALDMTSYNLPNFVEEKTKGILRTCDRSLLNRPGNSLASNHCEFRGGRVRMERFFSHKLHADHGSGYVRNTEVLEPIVPVSRSEYRKRVEAELAEARAESFRKTSSRYIRDPSNLSLAGVSPKSKSRKMMGRRVPNDSDALIGDQSLDASRYDQRATTGRRTMNVLAAGLDRKLAGARAGGKSGYSRAIQELSSGKRGERLEAGQMPSILPSRHLLPKVRDGLGIGGGGDSSSSEIDVCNGDGSGGGSRDSPGQFRGDVSSSSLGVGRGSKTRSNYERALTSHGRGGRSGTVGTYVQRHHESEKEDDSQEDLMRSLEDRWRQLGLPTSSDLRCVFSPVCLISPSS